MRKNKSKDPLGRMAKKIFHNSKLGSRGQVLGTALIMGAVILIFALAMVSMLRSTAKLNVKANTGTTGVLGADAAIDKTVETLKQGNNWGAPPSYGFTPIPGYNSDTIYTDIPHTEYVVSVNPGNLLSPPGDKAYERTISVDVYSLPATAVLPAVLPTPWTYGGAIPSSYSNHRTVQAVFRRGTLNASIVAGGGIATNGNFQVFWGNVYDYYQDTGCQGLPPGTPCTTYTTISLPHNQNLGPGYPAFHTQYGCIGTTNAKCGGCSGGSGSTSSTVCTINDTGAVNPCGLYPNDPAMPPRPVLPDYKPAAKAIYRPGSGEPGYGCSSGESGYFWCPSSCAGCTNVDSQTTSCGASTAGPAVESNHQYTQGSFSQTNVNNVLARMQQNLGIAGSWVGNDDLVFYVDTTNGYAMSTTDTSNWVDGSSGVDFTNFTGFRGTFILMGSYYENGHRASGQNIGTVNAPDASWCPATASLSPQFNGFLYIGGNFNCHGSPQFYGSIDLEGTFSGSGTPVLYYRSNFNYNLVESGSVAMEKWNEIPAKAFPTPLPPAPTPTP